MTQTRSALTEQAHDLVAQVQRRLLDDEQQLHALGLDPAKVREIGRHLSPEQRAQAAGAVRADLDSVEQDVAQARAQLQPGEPTKSRPLRPFI